MASHIRPFHLSTFHAVCNTHCPINRIFICMSVTFPPAECFICRIYTELCRGSIYCNFICDSISNIVSVLIPDLRIFVCKFLIMISSTYRKSHVLFLLSNTVMPIIVYVFRLLHGPNLHLQCSACQRFICVLNTIMTISQISSMADTHV